MLGEVGVTIGNRPAKSGGHVFALMMEGSSQLCRNVDDEGISELCSSIEQLDAFYSLSDDSV